MTAAAGYDPSAAVSGAPISRAGSIAVPSVFVIEVAQRIADEVLAPAAEDVDQGSIPSSHLAALSNAGLFSLEALAAPESRRVMAAIAGGCGATFFVWVQHHGVLRTLSASSNELLRAELLPPLRSGQLLAGTAFAHARRRGRPAVTARRIDGGWQLDGTAPWATSWGIADRFCVAAESSDGQLVWVMLPADGGPGVAVKPLHLPVFTSTGTVALKFERCAVDDDAVVLIEDAASWRRTDRHRASTGQPAVLGVAARAVALLRQTIGPDDADAQQAIERLDRAISTAWSADDEIIEELAALGTQSTDSSTDAISRASDHRARCLQIGQRCALALLAAVGGHGMDLSNPAQRLMREADFYVIQAQTADGRSATLRSV